MLCFCLLACSTAYTTANVSLLCRASPEMGTAEEGKSGNSPAPPPAGPTGTHLQSVEDMLRHLKQNKLTEGRPIKTHRSSTPSDNVCLVGENSGRIKWIQPSGECHCLPNSFIASLFACLQAMAVLLIWPLHLIHDPAQKCLALHPASPHSPATILDCWVTVRTACSPKHNPAHLSLCDVHVLTYAKCAYRSKA